MIVAKGRQIKELTQTINISEVSVLQFTPEPPMKKLVAFHAFDAVTGEDLSKVLIKVKKVHSKIITQGLTQDDGYHVFTITENCPHVVEVFKKGYISYTMTVNMTKRNETIKSVKVPLMPIQSPVTKKIQDPKNPDRQIEVQPAFYNIVYS